MGALCIVQFYLMNGKGFNMVKTKNRQKYVLVEFEKDFNPDYDRNNSKHNPFEELNCRLIVSFFDGKNQKVRTSNFLDMDSDIRLAIFVDDILRDKFDSLDISCSDAILQDMVFGLIDGKTVKMFL